MKKYSAYKDSGIDWIGEIPADWKVQKFKYNFMTTTGISITRDELSDTGIYCLGYGPIHSRLGMDLDLLQDKVSKAPYSYYRESALAEVGDFIFCDTSEDIEGCGNNVHVKELNSHQLLAGSHTILSKPINFFNSRYMAYLFQTSGWRSQIRSKVFGVKVNSITQKIIKDTYILLPDRLIQERIVDFLDHKTIGIDDAVKGKQKLIELLKEKRHAIITQAVTKGLDAKVPMKNSGIDLIGDIPEHWEFAKIKYLSASPLLYGANESGDSEESDDPRYIRITDIDDDGNLKKGTFKSLSRELAKSYMLNKGDILFARSGATVGKSYIHTEDIEACFAGYLIKLTTNREVAEPKFIYYHTKSNIYDNWIKQNTIQATIQNVSAEKYNNYVVTLPSLTEQKKITKYLDEINAEIDRNVIDLSLQLEKLKEYRLSIISEAVTGKVVV